MPGFQHPCVPRRLVGILGKHVPATEAQIFREVRGTTSRTGTERPESSAAGGSTPSWVQDPMGVPNPFRAIRTPARKVVLTAPMPGRSTASFPGADFRERDRAMSFTSSVDAGSPPSPAAPPVHLAHSVRVVETKLGGAARSEEHTSELQ